MRGATSFSYGLVLILWNLTTDEDMMQDMSKFKGEVKSKIPLGFKRERGGGGGGWRLCWITKQDFATAVRFFNKSSVSILSIPLQACFTVANSFRFVQSFVIVTIFFGVCSSWSSGQAIHRRVKRSECYPKCWSGLGCLCQEKVLRSEDKRIANLRSKYDSANEIDSSMWSWRNSRASQSFSREEYRDIWGWNGRIYFRMHWQGVQWILGR